jgi:hypothetical protein
MRGVTIPAGGMVSVVVASVNRDETKYENPDVFDLDRRADDHLAPGFGRHHCLGSHVAKMEARLALNAIMDRWPNLRLDPDADRRTSSGWRSGRRTPSACRFHSRPVDPKSMSAAVGIQQVFESMTSTVHRWWLIASTQPSDGDGLARAQRDRILRAGAVALTLMGLANVMLRQARITAAGGAG